MLAGIPTWEVLRGTQLQGEVFSGAPWSCSSPSKVGYSHTPSITSTQTTCTAILSPLLISSNGHPDNRGVLWS